MHVRFRRQFRQRVCRDRTDPGLGQVGNVPDEGACEASLISACVKSTVQALIPKFDDPGGAVCVAEIRMCVVNARVDDGDEDAKSRRGCFVLDLAAEWFAKG